MERPPLRSPFAKVNGFVYFGRMLDKIRAHAKGDLPEDYQANLGKGFDGSCVHFLRVDYNDLVDQAKQGGRTRTSSTGASATAGDRPTKRSTSGTSSCGSVAGTMKSLRR